MTGPVSRDELEGLLEQAVERVAKKVLHDMGVPDDEKERLAFRRDLLEMRDVLAAWRDAREVIRRELAKWAVRATVLLIAAGAGWGLLHDKLK